MRLCSSRGRKEECSVFHFLHKFIWIRVGFPAVLTGCVRTAGNFCGWGQGKMQMGTPANAIGDVHFCKKCTSPIDTPVCLRYTLKVKIIESQINIGEYL